MYGYGRSFPMVPRSDVPSPTSRLSKASTTPVAVQRSFYTANPVLVLLAACLPTLLANHVASPAGRAGSTARVTLSELVVPVRALPQIYHVSATAGVSKLRWPDNGNVDHRQTISLPTTVSASASAQYQCFIANSTIVSPDQRIGTSQVPRPHRSR